MSERLRNTLSVVAITLMAVLAFGLVVSAPTEIDRVDQIGSQIKCPVCQGESIANSPAQMARDMMTLVSQRVDEGQTDDQIINELLGAYSGAVLLDPPTSGNTLALWIAPLVVLVAGVAVIVWWKTHPGAQPGPNEAEPPNSKRVLIGGAFMGLALIGVLVVAGFFVADQGGPNDGVADIGVQDLSEVSNETMEAVVAANLDNPQINGMRLALAERYFDIGDYSSAFPHYLAVAESPGASLNEETTSLIRLGWMAWDGNGATDAAIGMFDQALEVDASSSTARYLKGQVLWCGVNDFDAAADLFEEVLNDSELPNDSRALVRADLESVNRGETCT